MITKAFVEEIKHIITCFVNVYCQYDDLFFFSEGVRTPHFGHPVMKILAKTLLMGCHLDSFCDDLQL